MSTLKSANLYKKTTDH